MQDIFKKNDIQNYLDAQKGFVTRIYPSFEEMSKFEKKLNIDSSNIFEYSDGLFNYNDSVCYVLEGKIYPDEQYGINVIFINYNKDEIPTAIFVDNNFCAVADQISQMVRNSIQHSESV